MTSGGAPLSSEIPKNSGHSEKRVPRRSLSMQVHEFFRREFAGTPAKGQFGRESEWLDFCPLPLPSGKAHLVDASRPWNNAHDCLLRLRPGRYKLQIKVIAYAGDARISRLRLVASHARQPKLGRWIAATTTRSATIALYDDHLRNTAKLWQKPSIAQPLDVAWMKADPYILARLPRTPRAIMPVIKTGFGNAPGKVFALLDLGKRAGCEVVFIHSKQPYPFDPTEETASDTSDPWDCSCCGPLCCLT